MSNRREWKFWEMCYGKAQFLVIVLTSFNGVSSIGYRCLGLINFLESFSCQFHAAGRKRPGKTSSKLARWTGSGGSGSWEDWLMCRYSLSQHVVHLCQLLFILAQCIGRHADRFIEVLICRWIPKNVDEFCNMIYLFCHFVLKSRLALCNVISLIFFLG